MEENNLDNTVVFCDSSIHELCNKYIDKPAVVIRYPEPVTNNTGEYMSVLHAFETLIEQGYTKALVYTDSQLVVYQTNGHDDQGREWKNCKPHLRVYRDKIRAVLDSHPTYMLQWICRELNPAGKVLEKLK